MTDEDDNGDDNEDELWDIESIDPHERIIRIRKRKSPPVEVTPAPPSRKVADIPEDYLKFRNHVQSRLWFIQIMVLAIIIMMVYSSSRCGVDLKINDVDRYYTGEQVYHVKFEIFNKGLGSAEDVVIKVGISRLGLDGSTTDVGNYSVVKERIGGRGTEKILPDLPLEWKIHYLYSIGLYWEDRSEEFRGSFSFEKPRR